MSHPGQKSYDGEETFNVDAETGQVSDGWHTFDDLYLMRSHLFIALMSTRPGISWMAEEHSDGTMYEGWFIAGMNLPQVDPDAPPAQITFHLPLELHDLAVDAGAEILLRAPVWDGHTSQDVIERLKAFISAR